MPDLSRKKDRLTKVSLNSEKKCKSSKMTPSSREAPNKTNW